MRSGRNSKWITKKERERSRSFFVIHLFLDFISLVHCYIVSLKKQEKSKKKTLPIISSTKQRKFPNMMFFDSFFHLSDMILMIAIIPKMMLVSFITSRNVCGILMTVICLIALILYIEGKSLKSARLRLFPLMTLISSLHLDKYGIMEVRNLTL